MGRLPLKTNMPTIHKLDPQLTNLISAGEVLERPAQLVKELIENSLDAGATNLVVKVAEQGRELEISDDGHGMSAADLGICVDRFTTSKIREEADLWRLASFGFRGEALASLAAVADVEIRSRRGQDEGHSLRVAFGEKKSIAKVSCPLGTLLSVRDLFANVPARLKFLKTEIGELQAIRQVVKAVACGRADVGFKYFEKGQLVLQFPKETAADRAKRVLHLSEVFSGTWSGDGMRVQAYFSSPMEVQKTSRNLWLFVQGRWVQDRSLTAAILEAYRTFLMIGEFPSAAVFIEMSPDKVDVNVHPAKREVKFSEPSLVFKGVKRSIQQSLETSPWLKQDLPNPSPNFSAKPGASEQPLDSIEQVATKSPDPLPLLPLDDLRVQFKRVDFHAPASPSYLAEVSVPAEAGKTVRGYWQQLQVIGQANLTYMVCESGAEMIFIDQHAAHERILFERLRSAQKQGRFQGQNLLVPLQLQASKEVIEGLWRHKDEFEVLGVRCSLLGLETLAIESKPDQISDKALVKGLTKMGESLLDGKVISYLQHHLDDLFASWACHSAVRAGQALSVVQMQELLCMMDEAPQSSFCPHGRPVSIRWSYHEVEKDFGRTQ